MQKKRANAIGRKLYKHEADHNGLLQMIERVARQRSSDVRRTDTRVDGLFICRNKGDGIRGKPAPGAAQTEDA